MEGQEQYQSGTTAAQNQTSAPMLSYAPAQKPKSVTPLVIIVVLIALLLGAWMLLRQNDADTMGDQATVPSAQTTPNQDVDSIVTDIYTSTTADSQTTVNSSPADFSGLYQ